MLWIDWLIMCLPIAVVAVIAWYTRSFATSVTDFMAGGRCAGRYLLATARSEMGSGAVIFVALFEMFYNAGFTTVWWGYVTVPVGLLVSITGFVVYRYRQTRALTLAQFFETRYSRRFRLFTGALGFIAGILNFGIIPIIGARFFVHFIGLPNVLPLLGWQVPTQAVVMGLLLSCTVLLTTSGGQITVLVADCVEGMLSQIAYLIIIVALLCMFSWSQMTDTLLRQPPGKSLVNPFDSFSIQGFNVWYVLMSIFVAVYGTMAWQNAHAFNSSAISPHESRMGTILGRWREFARNVMITLLALAAITYLRDVRFANGAAEVHRTLQGIADENTRRQMLMPTALAHLLPIGIKGLLCSIILMGVISGDGMHLHSWGSILVQDVLVPLRRRPLETRQHLSWLRWSIVGVAVFAFVFGLVFTQTDFVAMWFQVTTAIYVGGAGAAIIGGLYWARGTTAGAWAGLLTGSLLSVVGVVLQQAGIWERIAVFLLSWAPSNNYLQAHRTAFPFNGIMISFGATLLAIASYVAVSIVTSSKRYDMDRLLHRGESDLAKPNDCRPKSSLSWRLRLMGIDEDFTRADRWVTGGIFWWSMFWFVVFALGSVMYLVRPWSDQVWAHYWGISMVFLPLAIGVATTVWFTIGGLRDLRIFFRRLRAETLEINAGGYGAATELVAERCANVEAVTSKRANHEVC